MNLIEIEDRQPWDLFIGDHPNGHPLQLWGWGEAKRGNGWVPHRLALRAEDDRWVGAAEVLLWTIPKMGKRIAYAPRGPVVTPGSVEAEELLSRLGDWAKNNNVLYLRIDPAWTKGHPGKGWLHSNHHLQLSETYTIDLGKGDEELLEPMSRKHRQYIRKSERDGVSVARIDAGGLDEMYEIYLQTAQRAGFGIHDKDYYVRLHSELGSRSYLYYAYFEGKPVAFLWLAGAGEMAYELYGGVSAVGAEMKANYFLKWHAIGQMKSATYQIYDFNGRLNEGVSRFKDGFGPDETDYIGTWDYPLNTLGYQVWEKLWPVAKPVGRWVTKLRSR
ncbi:MAG TPA: peptidoglycan bridge formation glycyltransferase FemA/FemB family protein [Candidatus Saccharimonadia bacterium]|nr:peptidoglycan bridge formation glycyltransferase FemA/FemB family protein [Candidatus Saccharimonadia bacterium]